MSRIQTYLLREVAGSIALSVGVFLFVFLAGNVVQGIGDRLASGQVTLGQFVELLRLILPFAAVYALPLGFLTGILLAYGRLSANREIVALRSVGVSFLGIARPALLLAVAGAAFTAWFNNDLGPRDRAAFREKIARSFAENPLRLFRGGAFIDDFPGYLLFVEEQQGDALRGFWVWQHDAEGRVDLFLRAERATVDYLPEERSLLLTLRNGEAETRQPDPSYRERPAPGTLVSFREFPVRLDLSAVFGEAGADRSARTRRPEYLTLAELRAEIRRDPANARPYRLQVQRNFSLAVAVLSLVLVALPLGVRVGRRETLANLGIALALGLLYYFLAAISGWVPADPPWLAPFLVWLPNALFLVLGTVLMVRASRA